MRIIVIAILSLFSNFLFGQQNLVLNPSCENYTSCPNALGQTNLLVDVYNPNANTPDFFHVCYNGSNNYASIPANAVGYQFPQNGQAFVGFGMVFTGNNNREYISFSLSDSLSNGKKYEISFLVSLADSVKYSTDKIGAYLHQNTIFQNNFFNLPYQPQVENTIGNFITDKINWIQIQGEYIAGGGEKFITIGNFYPDSLTDTVEVNNEPISSANKAIAYFYLDDISVIEIPDTTDTTTNPIDTTIYDISVFPNPNNGEFTLHYNLNEFSSGFFKIYNALGQIIFIEELIQNNGVRNLQVDLASGVYVWEVKSGDEILRREKMVVQR